MAEDGNRTAEVAVFPRGGIDGREQRAPCGARRHQIFCRLAVTPQERRRGRCPVQSGLRRSPVRTPEKEIGDASERRRDDNKGTRMRRDEPRCPPNSRRIRKRCAPEFPYLETMQIHAHHSPQTRASFALKIKQEKGRKILCDRAGGCRGYSSCSGSGSCRSGAGAGSSISSRAQAFQRRSESSLCAGRMDSARS